MTTVWILCGSTDPSSFCRYSIVTCVFPSGRNHHNLPLLRTSVSVLPSIDLLHFEDEDTHHYLPMPHGISQDEVTHHQWSIRCEGELFMSESDVQSVMQNSSRPIRRDAVLAIAATNNNVTAAIELVGNGTFLAAGSKL